MLASSLAHRLRLSGPLGGDATCSLGSAGQALSALRDGRCDVALVAAACLRPRSGYACEPLNQAREQDASAAPRSASGQARPFERRCDGSVPGSCAVALVLTLCDEPEPAAAGGDGRYALLRSVRTQSDGGRAEAAQDGSVAARTATLREALVEGGLMIGGGKYKRLQTGYGAEVALVECHGRATLCTSVPLACACARACACACVLVLLLADLPLRLIPSPSASDGAEIEVLRACGVGDGAAGCALGAAAATVGDCGGATALVSLLKAALSLHFGTLPPAPVHKDPSLPLRVISAVHPSYYAGHVRLAFAPSTAGARRKGRRARPACSASADAVGSGRGLAGPRCSQGSCGGAGRRGQRRELLRAD